MRPRVKPLHSRRGARKGKVSTTSARISVLQPCKSSTSPAVSGLRLFVLCRCLGESTRWEGLGVRDSWHASNPPTHNGLALFSRNSSNCLGAFLVVRQRQLLQPHANLSPKRGDTSRPIFAQQRARDTKDQILHPPCLHPRSYRPLQWHNSPVAQMCRPPGVKSHGTCVSCFVRRASAFAAVQVPLLLLRVPVGCRRREAGSSCGRRSSSQKTHSQHQP
jgi:hypothetical protein